MPHENGPESAGPSSQTSSDSGLRAMGPPGTQSLKRSHSSSSIDSDTITKRPRAEAHEVENSALRAEPPVERAQTPELTIAISAPGPLSLVDLSELDRVLTAPGRKPPPDSPRRLTRRQSRQSLSRASSSALMSAPPTPTRLTPFSLHDHSSSRGITPFSFHDAASIRSSSPAVPTFPETSAKHFLRETNTVFASHGEIDEILGDTLPMSWSQGSTLLFGRSNRVHMKTLGALNEDMSVLLKLKEHHGILRLLECGDATLPNNVAIATSKGLIQIWDISTKKMIRTWYTKPATALRWAGPVLSVGGEKGTIRHFDTRINDASKMKDDTKKVTRHQARITSLAWNHDGRVLASGDAGGVIYCWDNRVNQLGPLDVGDQIQRNRRKMQHAGAVKALAWCPWSLKVLSSGDAAVDGSGTIRLWNINETSPKPPANDRISLNAQVTSLQWSTHCKELLSTHSIIRAPADDQLWDPYPSTILKENAVAVHAFPSLNHVTTEYPARTPILGSALSPSGCKIAFALPGEKIVKIWDVWGKRKEPKRQRSMTEGPCGIR